MQGKIALEEHVAIEPTLSDSKVFGAHVWGDLGPRLIDVQDTRLREMDKHGIEMMILSLNAPAVQDPRRMAGNKSNQSISTHHEKLPQVPCYPRRPGAAGCSRPPGGRTHPAPRR